MNKPQQPSAHQVIIHLDTRTALIELVKRKNHEPLRFDCLLDRHTAATLDLRLIGNELQRLDTEASYWQQRAVKAEQKIEAAEFYFGASLPIG